MISLTFINILEENFKNREEKNYFRESGTSNTNMRKMNNKLIHNIMLRAVPCVKLSVCITTH